MTKNCRRRDRGEREDNQREKERERERSLRHIMMVQDKRGMIPIEETNKETKKEQKKP
jgi:hypothetical protein